jgi:hypothetical protein
MLLVVLNFVKQDYMRLVQLRELRTNDTTNWHDDKRMAILSCNEFMNFGTPFLNRRVCKCNGHANGF